MLAPRLARVCGSSPALHEKHQVPGASAVRRAHLLGSQSWGLWKTVMVHVCLSSPREVL